MANGEPSQSWRIEVEQTDRFIRSREYKLGGPQSLSWAKHYYERDRENPFEMKLDSVRQVEPWPELEWEVEAEVPVLDAANPDAYWRSLNSSSFLDERVKAIPSSYPLCDYLLGMVDQSRRPRRVRIEYQQSAYRGVCTITVLAWGKPDLNREDYVARPSMNGAVLSVMAAATDDEPDPAPPLSESDRVLSMEGVHLGMASREVLELWQEKPLETQVRYRQDRGTVIGLGGPWLDIENKPYRAGEPAESLLDHLKKLGFEELSFPGPVHDDPKVEEQMKAMQENFKMLHRAPSVVTLELENGRLKLVHLSGGYENYEFEHQGLDWMGPPPTIQGVSLLLTEDQVLEKLGVPARIHRQGELRTLCYEPESCQDSVQQPVKLHLTFEAERCRAIRGFQLEQSGELKLGSQFQMPPPHSLQQVEQLSSMYSTLHSRSTGRKEGPVTVGYCTDLGLEVWIYPDGERQFILRDVDLPKTVINLDFP